jgi:hypothetical protein
MPSQEFFMQPAYALVIGISKYQYGKELDKPLDDKEFPNLRLADKDAQDFATFLKEYGFIPESVRSLLNEKATLRNIKIELNQLGHLCERSDNPLVIVYFSGHGWADGEHHYLIPYDGERDQLRVTALANREFNEYLNLQTNRLVVFLDACHAGAMGKEGEKGGLQQYDFRKDLGAGDGRYFIASCEPGQKSYEWEEKGNSIFTSHLLQLLKCETNDFDNEPEIDVLNLIPKLRDKVELTANEKFGKKQTPTSETKGTGMVLAINPRVRDRRIQENTQAREIKSQFVERISTRIGNSMFVSNLKSAITAKLKSYVDTDGRTQFSGYEEFYGVFNDYLTVWKPGYQAKEDECIQLLIDSHQRGMGSVPASKQSQAQEPSKPSDRFAGTAETKTSGSEQSTKTPALPLEQQQQRQLSEEDCQYILGEIVTRLNYYRDSRELGIVMSRPISQEEFSAKVYAIGINKKNDITLDEILTKIVERFQERWPQAKAVESISLSSFMMGKSKDE